MAAITFALFLVGYWVSATTKANPAYVGLSVSFIINFNYYIFVQAEYSEQFLLFFIQLLGNRVKPVSLCVPSNDALLFGRKAELLFRPRAAK